MAGWENYLKYANEYTQEPMGGWGIRADGTQKGNGFFGPHLSGFDSVETELGATYGGEDGEERIDAPTINPLQTAHNIYALYNTPMSEMTPEQLKSIHDATINWSIFREMLGLPAFATPEEEGQSQFPETLSILLKFLGGFPNDYSNMGYTQ